MDHDPLGLHVDHKKLKKKELKVKEFFKEKVEEIEE